MLRIGSLRKRIENITLLLKNRMTSEDFAKIFYSNFTPAIDWANIDEIAWMYQEGLLNFSTIVIASLEEFTERIDFVSDAKNGFMKNGESDGHLVLKSFAKDYLTQFLGIKEEEICFEHPLIGFEVDVIDKDLHFPAECGSTNALKLEKYLALPSTKKMLIFPYPHSNELKVYIFEAKPSFFDYIKHKQNCLNQKNKGLR